MPSHPVVVATDLTDAARPALVRGRGHAEAIGVPLLVCHVVLDVFRSHPLLGDVRETETMLDAQVMRRAAELVTDQVGAVLRLPVGAYRVVVNSGDPADEIVRIAEAQQASLVVVGARPEGAPIGRVAEEVVRYAYGPVLLARENEPTGKLLVATDFSPGSLRALTLTKEIVRATSASATLLHVVQRPSSFVPSALMPLGDTWTPPSKAALDQLEVLGVRTLEDLSKEYGLSGFEQLHGKNPAEIIVRRAEELDAEMIILGSRGRTGLARLVLGSVAEKVMRMSRCSVLVAR